MFLEILARKTAGVFNEQNKSNETIQRHESDTAIDLMPMDKILIDIWFVSSV